MQCIACKRPIAFFRRTCPHCSFDQRLRAFAGVRAEESDAEEDVDGSGDLDRSILQSATGATSREIKGYEFALKGCTFYVRVQRARIEAEHGGTLPDKAGDPFSLGYLSGTVDAWMQASSVEHESLCMTGLATVFEDRFGSEWESYLSEAMTYMRSGEPSFVQGMSRGGNDAFENIKQGLSGGGSPILTWEQHASS